MTAKCEQPCRASVGKHRGFTIVEVLVVILLIGLLAVFIVPPYINRAEQARRDLVPAQMAIIENALAMFYRDCGRYPEQAEKLDVLITSPQGLVGKWKGPYCKGSQLLDPWGNPLVYQRPGTKNRTYDIISYGRDGQPAGEGENADIYND